MRRRARRIASTLISLLLLSDFFTPVTDEQPPMPLLFPPNYYSSSRYPEAEQAQSTGELDPIPLTPSNEEEKIPAVESDLRLPSTALAITDTKGTSLVPLPSRATRELLDADPERPKKLLRFHENGSVEVTDFASGATLWEFSTGPPLSSLEHGYSPRDGVDYFIWPAEEGRMLYESFNNSVKVHPLPIEEYVSSSPHVTINGIVAGSKTSTVYMVNVDTGEVLYKHRILPVNSSDVGTVLEREEKGVLPKLDDGGKQDPDTIFLTIIRTDYSLSYSTFQGENLWKWTRSFLYSVTPFQKQGPIHHHRKEIVHHKPELPAAFPVVGLPEQPEMLPQHVQEHAARTLALSAYSRLVWFVVLLLMLVAVCYRKLQELFWPENTLPASKIVPPVISRKRKARRKDSGQKSDENDSSLDRERNEVEGIAVVPSTELSPLMSHLQPYEPESGRWVGKLFVSDKEIGKGSNGTVVFEGSHTGRVCAVKRLLHAHHDVALKEIQNLIASDQHPNIVRLYCVEQDRDFVYIALERCNCSLADLIQHSSDSKSNTSDSALWRSDGRPSSQLLKLMRDVVCGVAHLHELGIIHRDLKPQNVLIIAEGMTMKAKISDMGISKRLKDDISSFSHHCTGFGSSGWQAPEQLLNGRQTRAVDLFSLGCILFFCMTQGKHPFGERIERDVNILNNRFDLFMVDHMPEAVHLMLQLLQPNPVMRPRAANVLSHPFFWSPEMRVSFLRDTSDRIDKADEPDLLGAIEGVSQAVFVSRWSDKLDPLLTADMSRYRKYNSESTQDLLRLIRNKSGHYRELPRELQESLGSFPEGFDSYFSARFPSLLTEVYKVMCIHCKEERGFRKYFGELRM